MQPNAIFLSGCSDKTSQLQHLGVRAEEIRLGLVEDANGAAHNLTRLVVELVNGRVEDRLEDRNEVGGEGLDGGFVCLIWVLLA
jgi:hypothetical protein